MSIAYREIIPENYKSSYGEFDVVDFVAQFPQEMMNLNSIRLTGRVKVLDENGAEITTEKVLLDKLVGAHSFIEGIQTFVAGVSVENLGQDYPRMVKMLTSATERPSDMNRAENVCELKAPSDGLAMAVLRGEQVAKDNAGAVHKEDSDFSIKPVFCLNQVFSDRKNLSSSKVGDVRVSISLARNMSALYGLSVKSAYSYQLSDLRLCFTTYPDDMSAEPILFKRRMSLKQSFASNNAQLNFNVPMQVAKFYGSFQTQEHENKPQINNLQLERPYNIKELQYLWNNSTNEYISYQLRSNSEILERAIDAVADTGKNSASMGNLESNEAYLIGMNLDDYVDLSSNKMSVVINSDQPSGQPMLLYMFFEGVSKL